MAAEQLKHVFISYVRDDSADVDRLCAVLEAAQIPYWRDRTSLAPGDVWKAKIRHAIQDGSLVFLACFSERSRARDKSVMNEELTLAVDEFRKMPPGRAWLIPVRLDDGPVPEWDLGAGRVLGDLNYVNLFGDDYPIAAASLVTTIHNQIGDRRTSASSALAAVEQAVDADRSALMVRMTKEMLPDPARRIELDDLLGQEVRRILKAMDEPEKFPMTLTGTSNDEHVVELVDSAKRYWSLVEPFCASLRVAARWGEPESLAPWAGGIKALVAAANKVSAGHAAATAQRHLPGMLSTMVAGLACTSTGQWGNLKVLVVDPSVASRNHGNVTSRLIGATNPWAPFESGEIVANVLARSVILNEDVTSSIEYFRRGGKYYTPVAEWMHAILRPLFADQFHDSEDFDAEFDRAEVMLGFLSGDDSNLVAESTGSSWFGGSRWFGRSTHRAANWKGDPVGYFDGQLKADGAGWAPLNGGLFGASEARARRAIDEYAVQFDELKRRRH